MGHVHPGEAPQIPSPVSVVGPTVVVAGAYLLRLNPVSGIWFIPISVAEKAAKAAKESMSQSRFRYLVHSDAAEFGANHG